MRQQSSHNLISWLLVLAVVFAPVQAAVSAIDMLDHGQSQKSHCQMQMEQQADHEDSDKPDCCKNGFGCAKCISVHGIIPVSIMDLEHAKNSFDLEYQSLAQGILRQTEFRPPRSFS